MKTVILIFLLLFNISFPQDVEIHNESDDNYFYAIYDNLRLRMESNDKSQVIDFINEGEQLYFLGETSSSKFTTKIRGKEITDNWYKVKSHFGEIGWIFGGGVKKTKVKEKVKILILGEYHADEAEVNSGTNFYAIINKNNISEIVKTKVYVKSVSDPLVDEGSQKTGRQLYIKNNEIKPTFLIRGFPLDLKNKISGIKSGQYNQFDSEALFIDSKNHEYKFICIIEPKYRLDLHYKKEKISIFQHASSNDKLPKIYWAGDINGAGILDFLIDSSDHYNVSDINLFLSEKKNGKILFKKINGIRSVGC